MTDCILQYQWRSGCLTAEKLLYELYNQIEKQFQPKLEKSKTEIYWEKNNGILNLHSYVVKTKSLEKRNALLL